MIAWMTFGQTGYVPRKEMFKSIPEAQTPDPTPLPSRDVPMHHRYHNAVETNAWFTLYLGTLNRRVYGIEPHETWIVTTVEPKVSYENGKWTTKF